MSVQGNLLPTHNVKTLGAMKAECTVKSVVFELTLAPASQVAKGLDATKLKYKLKSSSSSTR